jgi:phosphoserine phosphatase RsbU/P
MVAGQVALAVEARRSNVERAAAAAVARSLIPTRLPVVLGLDLAARYLPAHEGGVGGDWYDVFRLPDGHFGVVMGDVVGRGLAAAVVMGRLRSALVPTPSRRWIPPRSSNGWIGSFGTSSRAR